MIRKENLNRVIIAQININSIRNKFDMLSTFIGDNIDILVITETKIDNSFPTKQFLMAGFSEPYRIDRNQHGGGILVFVRDDIPCHSLITKNIPIEALLLEINLRKKKWLLCCSYNPHKSSVANHLYELQKMLDIQSANYDNFLLVGDFNAEPKDKEIVDFCQTYNMQNIVNDFTCYKNHNKPTCIDLMITNRPKSFLKSKVIETGLSDFHKMTVAILRMFFSKRSPNIIKYRDYRNFSNSSFRNDLLLEISNTKNNGNHHVSFQSTLMKVFNKHVPIKKRTLRANQAPFMNKVISKAIMHRSRLKNRYLKSRCQEHKVAYNQQRNYCVSLIRKSKKSFFNKIETDTIVNSKKFWTTVKPFFSEKNMVNSKINLIENNEIVSDDSKIANTFNDFFVNIVPSLEIKENEQLVHTEGTFDCQIERILDKYKFHPSVKTIKENLQLIKSFSFRNIQKEFLISVIDSLDSSKTCQKQDIPIKVIKNNSDIFSNILFESINHCFSTSCFPDELKHSEVIPIHKKDSKLDKANYRPVSILLNFSKIFEICMFEQISNYFENILSKYQFGFRKGFNAQQCFIAMIELWKKSVDQKKAFGALLTDLSKAFDCVNHELLIAKCAAYGLDYLSLKLLFSYLENRKQTVRINYAFSESKSVKYGVPQGSVLGPLLFNIYICDLFVTIKDWKVANYADDTTPYVMCDDMESVIISLESCSKLIFTWFENNYMKANSDKSHLLLSTDNVIQANINNDLISNSKSEKLLGVTVDSKLKFDEHVNKLCDKASQKLSALARVSPFMSKKQKRKIMKAFITSQFGYCPLVWMFCSRAANNRINRIHERSLRIVYNDNASSFLELLDKDCSVSIHHRNLQVLCIEIYKIKNNLSSEVLKEVFKIVNSNYNLRKKTLFEGRNIRTEQYGFHSLSYIGPKIWCGVPEDIKSSETLTTFKNKIKKWKPIDCPCRICKVYIQNLGYI